MSIRGVNIDQFDIPVCTSFKATILNDQLCYEVDLNTGCPTIEFSLCFCYFVGFYSS